MYIGLSQWDCDIFLNVYYTVNLAPPVSFILFKLPSHNCFPILIIRETFNNKYAWDEIKLKIITR